MVETIFSQSVGADLVFVSRSFDSTTIQKHGGGRETTLKIALLKGSEGE